MVNNEPRFGNFPYQPHWLFCYLFAFRRKKLPLYICPDLIFTHVILKGLVAIITIGVDLRDAGELNRGRVANARSTNLLAKI